MTVVDPVAFRVEQAEATLARVIPARFADAVAEHPQVVQWAGQFIDNPQNTPSLVLAGPTGVGKTHQCWGLVRHIAATLAGAGRGLVWRATTHPDLNDQVRPKPDGSHTWALDKFLSAELLFVDDLGAGKQTEWTGDTLFRLVDHRWAHQLPTVWSTNLTPPQLAETVGDRVVSRLADATHVTLQGRDRRWAGAA